ncbi:MAG: LysM peptidoglycan-binding domain-containing protein [Deltaproteobacteria bacterium]|nr:LysM peptidoglycan-binding domain-containing protein [Deltaproteobacteria bacterium]
MKTGSILLVVLLAMAQSTLSSAEPESTADVNVVDDVVDVDAALDTDLAGDAGMAGESDELVADSDAVPAPLGEIDELDSQSVEEGAEDFETAADAESEALDAMSDTAPESQELVEASDSADADPLQEVAWDDFDDPEFNPAEDRTLVESEMQAAAPEAAPVEIRGSTLVVNGVTLGPVGIDANGVVGRVHTVRSGDTLWDVSNAYLGTAWVWPSVWKENLEIANPHLIEPGDRLWISSTEIRAISEEEADAYLSSGGSLEEPVSEEVAGELPADFDPDAMEDFPADDDEFAELDEFEQEEMDQLPVGLPDDEVLGNETGRVIRVSMRENMGFVSDAQLEASTSILGSTSEKRNLSMLDTIFFGIGEGEVEVGDQFTFFRNITDVRSPSTRKLIGYHVDILGWAEVIEVTGESSVAVIRSSVSPTVKGDRVMPRYRPPTAIKVKYPQENMEGEIAFLPASRTLMGTTDYVFVDVGATQGVEIGTDLEVFDPGRPELDNTRDEMVLTPDRVIADLIVVTVQEESSVAYIAHTRRELAIGDAVRGATRDFPSAF